MSEPAHVEPTSPPSPSSAPEAPSPPISRRSLRLSDPRLRARIDRILTEPDTVAGRVVELIIAVLIVLVCAVYVAESSQFVPASVKGILHYVEVGITLIFLVEYLIRWWAKGFSVRYLFTPLAIIDLVCLLPLFLPAGRLQFVRVLRLFRILRILRLVQSRKFFFGEVHQEHLLVLRILFTIFCIVFISGGLIFELEKDANHDKFTSFFDAIYFAIVTLTTVGFGDLTPITWEGRAVTMVMILAGVLILPWQLTTLARAIVAETNKVQVTCRHCGLRLHDRDASHCKACGNLIYQEYDGDSG